MPLHVEAGRCRGEPQHYGADRRTATLSHPKQKTRQNQKKCLLFLLFSEATMSAHAFEVLSRARNEIEVCHTAEGHRFKFFVVTNAHGKRILSESVEVVAKEGATHTPEFFSGSARAFAITVAHRSHAID